MRPPADLTEFDRVFADELHLIERRRARGTRSPVPGPYDPEHAADLGLVGLALSGGGIRSACFNLGLLQSLSKAGILARTDYLSTVSGGGYIGSCLSSLLSVPAASVEHGEAFPFWYDGVHENPVVKHLRRHGQYLAVRNGILRLHTWRLVSAYLGGLLVTLPTVLLLLAVVAGSCLALYPRLYFVAEWIAGVPVWLASARADRLLWDPVGSVEALLAPALAALALWVLSGLALVAVEFRPSLWTLRFRVRLGWLQAGLLGMAVLLGILGLLPLLLEQTHRAVVASGLSLSAVLASTGLVSSLSLGGLGRVGQAVRDAAAKVARAKRWAIGGGAALLVLVACFAVVYAIWRYRDWAEPIALAALVGLWLLARLTDINRISMFYFYRDRLSEAFIVRGSPGRPDGVEPNDGLRLSELAYDDRPAPYHLVNTCVNLPGSAIPELRDRKADFFLLSPLYCGSTATRYRPTTAYEGGRLQLAWAMAVSGAAANPQFGARTRPALAFLLTMLNARLGVWVQNPRVQPTRFGESGSRSLWPYYLLLELLAAADESRALINLSDGGHIENLGVYELLRRRCRVIVASDASADPGGALEDLGNVMRKARIDLGVQISLDVDEIRQRRAHAAVGEIRYVRPGGETAAKGTLVYVKATLTDGDPQDLHEYRRAHEAFPHETTVDQFFDEAQFESYRELGYQSGKEVGRRWDAGWT